MRKKAALALCLALVLLMAISARPAAAGIDRFTPFGPMSGDLAAVAVDPRLPAHLLLATATTGLYGSTDGGHAWGGVTNGLRQERLLATAFDPANPGSVYGISSTAAFHSADGGKSWAIAGSEDFAPPPGVAPVGPAPARLVLLSGDPGALPTLLVGVGSHLLRSADGGATWSTVFAVDLPTTRWIVAVDPGDPRQVWAGAFTTGTDGGLVRSADGGQTWTRVPNLPVRFEPGVLALTVVPTRPATIYAATDAGLFASGDAGATWRRVAILASPDPLIVTGLAFEPGNPSVLYAADFENLFVSTDGGVTWTRRTGLLQAEILSLVPVPGTRTVYSLTENALEVSFDRGRHWTIAVLSGAGSNLVRLRFQPETPSTIYAVEGGGAFESTDGGITWVSLGANLDPLNPVLIFDATPDPSGSGVLYLTTDRGVFRTEDEGKNWTALRENGAAFLEALDRRTLLGGGCGVDRSRDGGRTWTTTLPCHFGDPSLDSVRIDRLQIDPRHPNGVYAEGFEVLGRPGSGTTNLVIFKSSDYGVTWQRLVDDGNVLAFDPSRSGRLYVLRRNGLFRSDDAGRTFRMISSFAASGSGLTPTALLVDPVTPATLYAATFEQGVWRSTDSGVTWAPINAGLARYGSLQTYGLALHPTVHHLLYAFVATGIFQNQRTEP